MGEGGESEEGHLSEKGEIDSLPYVRVQGIESLIAGEGIESSPTVVDVLPIAFRFLCGYFTNAAIVHFRESRLKGQTEGTIVDIQ